MDGHQLPIMHSSMHHVQRTNKIITVTVKQKRYENLTSCCTSVWEVIQGNAFWVRKTIHGAVPHVSGTEAQQGCSSWKILLHHIYLRV